MSLRKLLAGAAWLLAVATAHAGPTTTTFTSSTVNPSAYGQPTRFYAAVSPSTATGTVTFKDGTTTLGTATLSAGTATMFKAFEVLGARNLSATYNGDANNTASTSAVYLQTVNPAVTTTALTSSPAPSNSGQAVTLTATLTSTGYLPTGSVTFKDGSTTLGTSAISGSTAAYTTSALSTGAHSLTAQFAGSSTHNASTSAVRSHTVNTAATMPATPPASPAPVMNYEYDAEGNPTKTTQAPGVAGYNFQTTATYDSLNRTKDTTDPQLGKTQFAYNGREDLTQVTDPRNLITQYNRDGLGQTTALISPDTGTAGQTYDAAGNLKARTDARGVLSSYSYDALNRLTQLVHSKTGLATQTFSWTYDQTGSGYAYGVGRLTSSTHPNGSAQFTYDAQGRLLTAIQRVAAATGANSSQISHTVSYGYTNGALTSITYPSGRKLSITYTGGKPSKLALAKDAGTTPTDLITQIQMAPDGQVESWQWQMLSTLQPYTREYDMSGRLVRHRLGPVVRDITYDAADRITGYTHYDAVTAAPQTGLNQSFGYDENGRLTTISMNATSWTINYDANGNRTSVSLNGSPSTYTTPATSNKLASITSPARSFGYDSAGNTTSDSTSYTATYDAANRLATLAKAGVTTTYSYNGFGQRVRKFSSSGAASTVIFVYDQEGHLLGEYDNTGKAIREYVWLGDTLIAMFVPDAVATNPPIVYYAFSDHLGTPRVMVDKNNAVRWRWMAEPFGATAPETNPSGLGSFNFPLRMPGQYADSESGLFYNYFRNYDSTTGRYTTSDPIGLDGGINTYAYVQNNPLSFVDPNGLQVVIVVPGTKGPRTNPDFPPYAGPNATPIQWPELLPQSWVDKIKEWCRGEDCPPCKTVSGKIVPLGTVAYRPLDTPSKPEHGIVGPHYNIYKANQAPRDSSKPCHCFWQAIGAVQPGGLPSGAIPIEPFAN